MANERPTEPWWSFLTELDAQLDSPADLHCIGGFIVSQYYGFGRETADLDMCQAVAAAERAQEKETAATYEAVWAWREALCGRVSAYAVI